jgi:predicted DNA-binding protein
MAAEDVVRLPVTGVRREVLEALDTLSRTTGLSVSYLLRSVIEQHLSGLGLLSPADPTPTRRRDRSD